MCCTSISKPARALSKSQNANRRVQTNRAKLWLTLRVVCLLLTSPPGSERPLASPRKQGPQLAGTRHLSRASQRQEQQRTQRWWVSPQAATRTHSAPPLRPACLVLSHHFLVSRQGTGACRNLAFWSTLKAVLYFSVPTWPRRTYRGAKTKQVV